jgi:hypothetical protein
MAQTLGIMGIEAYVPPKVMPHMCERFDLLIGGEEVIILGL